MILIGIVLTSLSIIAPDVRMLGENFAWLPANGFVLIMLGLLRFLDAYVAKSLSGNLLNTQGGIIDSVVGALILFSVSGTPEQLIYLVSGYLIIQGIQRNKLLSIARQHFSPFKGLSGLISVLLGFLIWLEWPLSAATWFLSFSLSIDLILRGWALLIFAKSLTKIHMTDT